MAGILGLTLFLFLFGLGFKINLGQAEQNEVVLSTDSPYLTTAAVANSSGLCQNWALKWTTYSHGHRRTKRPLKGVDWKAGDKPGIKKRLPKKMRQIPECYFLPCRSLLYNTAFSGACIAGGIGAGMLVEMWINKLEKMEAYYGSLRRRHRL